VNVVERPREGETIEAVADAIDRHLSQLSESFPIGPPPARGASRKAARVA
jgi:hypothetical protein